MEGLKVSKLIEFTTCLKLKTVSIAYQWWFKDRKGQSKKLIPIALVADSSFVQEKHNKWCVDPGEIETDSLYCLWVCPSLCASMLAGA